MPNYDFRCNRCGLTEERNLPSHVRVFRCGSCIGGMMERLPSAPAFVLKGAGWPGKEIKGAKGEPHDQSS